MSSGKPTLRVETQHEHHMVQPFSGPQPAPLPNRQQDGRDGYVSAVSDRAVRQQRLAARRMEARPPSLPSDSAAAGPFAVAAPFTNLAAMATPAALFRPGARKRTAAAADVERTPATLPPSQPRRGPVEVPTESFVVDFDSQLDLITQVERHAKCCAGKLSWRKKELSTHGVVGRLVGRCALKEKCPMAAAGKEHQLVWSSSPKNQAGERQVLGRPFVDYLANDRFAVAAGTTSVQNESFVTALMAAGLKPRSDTVTHAYQREILAPAVQQQREAELEREIAALPRRANGEGGQILLQHDVGHTGTCGQWSTGVGNNVAVCTVPLTPRTRVSVLWVDCCWVCWVGGGGAWYRHAR